MAAFLLLLLAVCLCDYRSGKIPNALVIPLCILGFGLRIRADWPAGAVEYVKWFLISVLCAYPLFKIGALGAGDAKLLAACAGCLSGGKVIWFFLYSLLFAALISIVKICREGNGRERFRYFLEYTADCIRTGQIRLYMEGEREGRKAGICLSGPMMLSVLLYAGGVY